MTLSVREEIQVKEINTSDVDNIETLHRQLIFSYQLFEIIMDIERFVLNQKIPTYQIE